MRGEGVRLEHEQAIDGAAFESSESAANPDAAGGVAREGAEIGRACAKTGAKVGCVGGVAGLL